MRRVNPDDHSVVEADGLRIIFDILQLHAGPGQESESAVNILHVEVISFSDWMSSFEREDRMAYYENRLAWAQDRYGDDGGDLLGSML